MMPLRLALNVLQVERESFYHDFIFASLANLFHFSAFKIILCYHIPFVTSDSACAMALGCNRT